MRKPEVKLAVKFFKICLSPNDLPRFLILTSSLVFLLEALNSISVLDVCFLSLKSANSFIKLWASSILYFAFVLRAFGPLLNHSISARTLLDITASSLFCCSIYCRCFSKKSSYLPSEWKILPSYRLFISTILLAHLSSKNLSWLTITHVNLAEPKKFSSQASAW